MPIHRYANSNAELPFIVKDLENQGYRIIKTSKYESQIDVEFTTGESETEGSDIEHGSPSYEAKSSVSKSPSAEISPVVKRLRQTTLEM